MTFEIRKMTPLDFDNCAKELILAFQEEPWNETWTYEQAFTRIKEIMSAPVSRGYIITDNNKVIGMTCGRIMTYMANKLLFIDEFSIHPDYQGQNLGSKLMTFVQQELIKENVYHIQLMTEQGFPCVKFYEKNGFMKDTHGLIMMKKIK